MKKTSPGLIHGNLAAVLPQSLTALQQPGDVRLRLGGRIEHRSLNPAFSFLFTEFQGFSSSVWSALRLAQLRRRAWKYKSRKKNINESTNRCENKFKSPRKQEKVTGPYVCVLTSLRNLSCLCFQCTICYDEVAWDLSLWFMHAIYTSLRTIFPAFFTFYLQIWFI